jgi:large subunit ribosomal protein L21
MYAIIEDGARQYRVSEGEVVKVDFRRDEKSDELQGAPAGTAVEFGRVLLYRNGDELQVGQPLLDGMRVLAEIVDHPSTKTYIQKFRKRKNYRRLRGHRQHYTSVRVKHILLPGQQAPQGQPAPQQETPPATTN